MKKVCLILMITVGMLPAVVFGQGFLGDAKPVDKEAVDLTNGPYEKAHVANRKPIPYVHVREADVMWQKTIYRIVDLRERINLSLYYPIQPTEGRYSLMGLLLDRILVNELPVYSTMGEEFKTKLPMNEILRGLGSDPDEVAVPNATTPNAPMTPNKIDVGDLKVHEVKKFMVKEVWFFDRNYSRMDVRIIGLCPIREYMKEGTDSNPEIIEKQLFWVYFPEVRPLLASNEVFSPKNEAVRNSFDDIFIKRYFGSYIFKEANVYNRAIIEYTAGMESMLEAQRIKHELFQKEHDMWEF